MKLRALTRILPTRRTALLVAAAAPVWLLAYTAPGRIAAILASVIVIGIILSDVVRLPASSAIDIAREVPDTAGLGDAVHGEYIVDSRWSASFKGALFDSIPRELRDMESAPVAFSLKANGRYRIPIAFTPAKRGRYGLGTIAARVNAPLGLVQRTIDFAADDSISVAPSLAPVRQYQLLAMNHRLREMGIRTIRRRGEGRSFSNLRDYSLGDDPRFIDWKHTARRGKLISREFTEERGQTVMIVIDAGRMMTQLAGDLPRFEHALSSALVLASVAANGEDRVGLMVFDESIRAYIPPARGKGVLRAIRNALISIQPVLSEPDYSSAFSTLASRLRSRALIVLFTDLIDSRASRALIANTTRRDARHIHLVVALKSDPLFDAAAPNLKLGVDGLYRSAAAEELVLARNEALQKMKMAHVAVVDVSPSAMTAAVVNRYLEIKARGEL